MVFFPSCPVSTFWFFIIPPLPFTARFSNHMSFTWCLISLSKAHTRTLCSDTRTRTHFSTHPSTHSVAQWASVIDLVSTIFTVPANNSARHVRCNINNALNSVLVSVLIQVSSFYVTIKIGLEGCIWSTLDGSEKNLTTFSYNCFLSDIDTFDNR